MLAPISARTNGSGYTCQLQGMRPEYLSQLLERGDHRSVHALERDIRAWITAWNEIPKPFVWTNTASRSSNPSVRLMKRINGAGH